MALREASRAMAHYAPTRRRAALSRLVDEIDTAAVLAALTPLWRDKRKPPLAFAAASKPFSTRPKARGSIGENPAAWRGHLAHLLPRRKTLARGDHAAMAYADIRLPRAIARAGSAAGAGAQLRIPTVRVRRSAGGAGAESTLAARVWTVPAGRTKAAREHGVPLCDRALAILEALAWSAGEFIFPGRRRGKPLSSMAMEMVLRRMNRSDATVHGFRSAFRDWAGEETNFPREIAEAALAHRIGDKAEQAYRRGDALEKRRALMAAWAGHCETGAGAAEFDSTVG